MPRQCQDHLGQPYRSVSDMCAAYGIPYSTYTGRISRGWSLEQALAIRPDGQDRKVHIRNAHVKDHTGREHPSVSAMCRAWGLSEKVYWSRKRLLKWPLEKILTTPVREPDDAGNAVSVTDHLGQEFKSISAMCRHWKIGLSTYRERRKRGWDIGRALTGQETHIETDAIPCTDHLGIRYPSKNAMCKAYGITRYCYDSRLKLGWNPEKALTEPHVINAKPCTDHTGKTFPASVYMAMYLGFPKYVFHRSGPGLEKLIPGLAEKHWPGRLCGPYTIKRCIGFPWFLASLDGQDIVLSFDAMLDEYHRSQSFQPLPVSGVKDPYISIIKQVQWPWYLCRAGDDTAVLSYDSLIRLHAGTNFGMSGPGAAGPVTIGEEDDA